MEEQNSGPQNLKPIEEIQAEQGLNSPLIIRGGLGALLGGLIGAFIWTLVAVMTDYEIGYLAIGIGLLAGFGAKLLAHPGVGIPLQIVASIFAVIALIIAKYATFAYLAVKQSATDAYLSGATIGLFIDTLSEMLQFYDLLWVVLAAVSAWSIPRRRF